MCRGREVGESCPRVRSMLRKHGQDGRRTQRARPQLLRRRGTSALAAQTMCHRGERAGASPGGSMWHRVRRARGQLGRRGACALAAPMARQRGAMTRHARAAAAAWHPGSARRHGQRLGQETLVSHSTPQAVACSARSAGRATRGDEQMVRARGAAAQHAETGPGRGTVSRKAPVRVRGEKRSLSQSERVTRVDAAFHSENISHVVSRVCQCFLALDAPTDQRAIGKELSWVSVLRCTR